MRINPALISRLREIDWDFAGKLSDSGFSSIHFHPSRFASQVPASIIGLLSHRGDMVLDPFAGSGSTLVEAQRLDRHSIGIDINPIACLAARAKTIPKSSSTLYPVIETIKYDATEILGQQMLTNTQARVAGAVPPTVQAEKWFTPRVLSELSLLWAYIMGLKGRGRLLAETAFSSILLPACREIRHWGYVCDNTTPSSNKEADVLQEFLKALDRLSAAYQERDEDRTARFGTAPIPKATVVCCDATTYLRTLPSGIADLVMTSPPYFGVCDYVKAQRLSMEWFGLEIEPLRRSEIGARSKRHRRCALEEYLNDMGAIFAELRRCLKSGGKAVVVIGESAQRASVLRNIKQITTETGFRIVLDLNRTVSTQRRLAPSITGEHLYLLEK